MTTALAWLLVGLGLPVVTLQRRSVALGAVTLQALVVVGIAVGRAHGAGEAVAAGALGARALALAAVFLVLTARTRDPRPVAGVVGPLRRGALAVGLALLLIWLVPPIGLGSRNVEGVVLACLAFGLLVAATSRATVFQVLGIVLVENGLALAALDLPGASWLIELGVAFDLTLIALVAGVFHERIFAEFGAGDTSALASLRD
jgi:hydrogenase-4 component E